MVGSNVFDEVVLTIEMESVFMAISQAYRLASTTLLPHNVDFCVIALLCRTFDLLLTMELALIYNSCSQIICTPFAECLYLLTITYFYIRY